MTMQSLKDRLAGLKEQVEYDQVFINRLGHEKAVALAALEQIESSAIYDGDCPVCTDMETGVHPPECALEVVKAALKLMRGEATP